MKRMGMILSGVVLVVALAGMALAQRSAKNQQAVLGEQSSEIAPGGWRTATVILVGDVMLGRSVNAIARAKNDFSWPFTEVTRRLERADVLVGNLEGPLLTACETTNEGMRFCADARFAAGLSAAGFDVLSLANNHALDYGWHKFDETVRLLRQHGMAEAFEDRVAQTSVNGFSVAVMGYDLVSQRRVTEETILERVKQVKEDNDVVVVMLHWGSEYTSNPSSHQRTLAHALVEAGADVVAGAHPHWVQEVEMYNDKPIFYSLGNFVFDQMWSNETRKGVAAEVTITQVEGQQPTLAYSLWPTTIYDYGRVEWGE